jgi:hypothetical protein
LRKSGLQLQTPDGILTLPVRTARASFGHPVPGGRCRGAGDENPAHGRRRPGAARGRLGTASRSSVRRTASRTSGSPAAISNGSTG